MTGLPLFISVQYTYITGWPKWFAACDRCQALFHCKGHYLKSEASNCARQHYEYDHYGVPV